MRILIKICAAALAFLPMDVFFLTHQLESLGMVSASSSQFIYARCLFLDFPAALVVSLVQTCNVSPRAQGWWTVLAMFVWSLLVALMFWKMVAKFFGEGEPDDEFDWARFQIRFVFGFAIGFTGGFLGLMAAVINGWWFVQHFHDPVLLLIAAVFCGVYVGLAVGVFRPRDIWLHK